MALDPEDFDFQGLGDKLTRTILDSFDDAISSIKLDAVSTNLVATLNQVDMGKVITDNLTKSPKVKAAMLDIQKKLEDGIKTIKFQVADLTLPQIPDQVVKVAADTSAYKVPNLKDVEVPVHYKYDKLKEPRVNDIKIPIDYVYSKFDLPKGAKVTVEVGYKHKPLLLPKIKDLTANVKFNKEKLDLPKPQEVKVPVSFNYSKFELPKVDAIKVPVSFNYSKLTLPKPTKLEIPVHYVYDRFILPTAQKILIAVRYVYDKFIQPKAESLLVPVKYKYDVFKLPQFKAIQIDIKYAYDKLVLPKVNNIKVAVKYVYDKFVLPSAKDIVANVKFAIEKLTLPKVSDIVVGVRYAYERFVLPKNQQVSISVNTKDAEKQISTALSDKTIPVSIVPEIAKTTGPTVDTSPFEKVGDLVREFVNLTQEANKKTTITTELYDRIVNAANKLVASKRMEKEAVTDIVNTLQAKLVVQPVQVSTKIGKVDTSAVDEATSKPVEINAKIGATSNVDFSGIERSFAAVMTKLGKQFQGLFTNFEKKKVHIDIPATERIDDLVTSYDDVKSAIKEVNSELSNLATLELALVSNTKETYNLQQKRIATAKLLEKAKVTEVYAAAKIFGIQRADLISQLTLKSIIAQKIANLHKEVELREELVNAIESYNSLLQDIDQSKLTIELKKQIGLTQEETVKKAANLALLNELQGGTRALTAEQYQTLVAEDLQLKKKRELLIADEAILNVNNAIIDTNKKSNLNIQTQQLSNQLGLLSEEAKLKAEAIIQQRILNGQTAELSSLEKQVLVSLDQEVASGKKLADVLAKVGEGQIEINNLIEQASYDQLIAELVTQKSLTEASVVSQAKALLAAKVAAGQAAMLTDEEMSQLQLQNNIVKAARERLDVTQKVIEATSTLSKTMQEGTGLATVMESKLYTELGLTQDLTREKAQAIVLDGLKNKLSDSEISKKLEGIKAEDALLKKLKERLDLSKDLETAADEYAKATRQAAADIQIKSLIVQLSLTEDEVAQKARLMVLDNERLGLGKKLTAEQIEQLKHDNHHLRHKREDVELTEQVALYQKHINEEIHHATAEWKKLGATIKAILQNPGFAKGVITATLVSGIHNATHAMHDFMEVGMQASEAVGAMRKSFSIMALAGLDKSSGVLKNMVQDFGTMNKLTKEELHQVGQMAVKMGLTEKEALDLTMAVSRMPGQTRETATHFKETAMHVGKMKGVMPSAIMKEMAKNSANMALYSRGGAEGFAKAAASAKKMGVELSSVLNAAEKTLDFESSINAQMEASVLLGREINMDKLRSAALSGDANAVLQEQQNLLKQAGGLENMNLLQKKKLAEAMGLTVEEMQKMNDEAKFQNQYFGEQAGIFDNISGYALKYGEAIGKGVMSIGPLVASIISLVLQTKMLSVARQQSTVATVKDTASEVNNAASKRLSAAAQAHFSAMQRGGVLATHALADARAMDAAMTTTQTTTNNVGYLSKMKNFILDKMIRAELAVRTALVRFFIGQQQASIIAENGGYIAKLRNIVGSRMATAADNLRQVSLLKLAAILGPNTALENASGLAKLRARAAALAQIAAEKLGIVSKQQTIATNGTLTSSEIAADAVKKRGIVTSILANTWNRLVALGKFLLVGSNQRVIASEGLLEAVQKRGLITGALVYAWQKLRAAGSSLYAAMINRESASESANTLVKQRGVLIDSIQANWKRIKTALGFGSAAANSAETVSENLSTASKGRGVIATLALNAVNLIRNGILLAGNAVLATGAFLLNAFGLQALFAGSSGATASTGIGALSGGLTSLTAAAGAIPVMLALGAAVLMVGGGVYLAATGMANLVQSFKGLTGTEVLGAVASLLMLNVAITSIVGTMAVLAFSGVGEAAAGLLLALGGAFLMIGAGIALAANGVATFTSAIKNISGLSGQLMNVSKALLSISKSLDALGLSGIKALPALTMITALSKLGFGGGAITPAIPATAKGPATPTTPGTTAPTTSPVTTVAPVAGTIPSSPAPAATAPATQQQKQTTKAEPTVDMSALMAKIDALIKAMPKDVILKLDGKEISKAALFNMNTSKFPG